MSKTRRKVLVRGRMLKVLDCRYVVKISENYRGLSYGDVISTWLRWLLSENPDAHQYGDILFLRGSLGYHNSNSTYLESFIEIPERMGILVPIVTTHFSMGDFYEGKPIKSEFYLRKAVREHVDAAGPFWGTLERMGEDYKVFRLVPNLESFRVESVPFQLDVSEKNPFLDKMDEPVYPGKYTALVSGYFVLLRDLPVGSYRLRFGGYGMDNFYTDSLYEINVISKEKNKVKDVSGLTFAPNFLLRQKKKAVKATQRNSG